MALSIPQKPNTTAPDAAYPFGRTRDKTPSLGGTPYNTLVMGDYFQFFAKLMDAAGVNANGLPDNNTNGYQLFEALSVFTGGLKTKVVNIGNWNMDTTANVSISIASLFPAGIAGVVSTDVFIRNDATNQLDPIINGGAAYLTATTVEISRTSSGMFDGANWSTTGGYNRGFIIIKYT